MSAWMVSNETLSRLANELFNLGSDYIFEELAIFKDKSPKEIFTSLAKMNIKALEARYPHSYKEMVGEVRYMPDISSTNKYQLLKSLHCYRYQCTEGQVPKCKLYKAINAAIGQVADEIATLRDEYGEAEWG